MYPNQSGYNPPFGAGYPPQMPQQQPPYGSPYPSQMPQPGMPPQPGMGQQPGMGYAPQYPYQPAQPAMPQYPGMPAMPNQMPQFPGQVPEMPQQQQFQHQQYGAPPPQNPYPGMQQPPAQGAYPQIPPQNAYPGMQQQPQYAAPIASPIQPQAPPAQQQYGGFGSGMPVMAQQQQQMYASPTHGALVVHTKGRPTVTPAPNFNAGNDAAILRKAMKGFGTDEDSLINVLCRRPSYQRVEIVRTYKTGYGKDLIDDIRSESSGNFQILLVNLLTPISELYCRELFEGMSGAGTDEDVLIEVMCTMSNSQIREICNLYHRMFGQPLENALRSDTSGAMKRLMTSLSVGGRDESMRTDVNQARQDAETLRAAGVGRWGTDESEFNRILCLRNYEQLKLISQEYERLTGSPLEKDIKREFSGDIEDALLAILRVANNRAEFFARRLHKSMAGLGTNDRSLIRLCITRSEIDMEDVKQEFQRYYGKSLKSFIKGDTSGHYKHGLYALCGENRS